MIELVTDDRESTIYDEEDFKLLVLKGIEENYSDYYKPGYICCTTLFYKIDRYNDRNKTDMTISEIIDKIASEWSLPDYIKHFKESSRYYWLGYSRGSSLDEIIEKIVDDDTMYRVIWDENRWEFKEDIQNE